MRREIESICNTIQPYSYVSFDVFDTLILRTVPDPLDIFLMVEALYKSRFKRDISTFHIKRRYASAFARRHFGPEVNIDQIYFFLDYPDDVKCELEAIEKECEIKNCVPNKIMVDVLNWCQKNKKTIIITSDMYLGKDVFDAIFQKNGIYYDYLFISSDQGSSKRDGSLYEIVLKKMGISASQLIHIGDNIESDLKNPKLYGIASIERIINNDIIRNYNCKNDRAISSKHLRCFFDINSQAIPCESESSYRIGYTVIGPFLYSFCRWLYQEKNKQGIGILMFVAREGYLIKKVYNELYPEEIDSTRYVCLNKNILRFPSLKSGENRLQCLLRSLPAWNSFVWKDILNHFYISELSEEAYKFYRHFSVTKKDVILRKDIVAGVYQDHFNYLFDIREDLIKEQYDLFRDYLLCKGFLDGKIGFVNNSKNGNAQILLDKFAIENNLNINIYGFQFVASEACLNNLKDSVSAYYSDVENTDITGMIFFKNSLVFEHLLFPPTGTAKLFERINGEVCVKSDDQGVEEANNAIIEEIQSYVLRYVNDYKRNIQLEIGNISNRLISNFFSNPLKEDAELIGNLWDKDVEKVRKFIDDTTVYPNLELFKRYNNRFVWPLGCFVAINKSVLFRKLWLLRVVIGLYLHNEAHLSKDIKCYISNIIVYRLKNVRFFIQILFCRISYIIKFRKHYWTSLV